MRKYMTQNYRDFKMSASYGYYLGQLTLWKPSIMFFIVTGLFLAHINRITKGGLVMNESNHQSEKVYKIGNLKLNIFTCNEQDEYKLLFFETKIKTGNLTICDLFQWLNLQDIYFTVHYIKNPALGFLQNVLNWFIYQKYSHLYPVTRLARQKHDSSDEVVQDIVKILDSSKFATYKM